MIVPLLLVILGQSPVDNAPPPKASANPAQTRGDVPLGPALREFQGLPVRRIEQRWSDGSLRRVHYVRADVPGPAVEHGPDLRWHENLELASRRSWVLGQQTGLSEEFWPSAYPKSAGQYIDDDKRGTWIGWHEDGTPAVVCDYKDGLRDGVERRWFASARPHSECGYRAGLREGLFVQWVGSGLKLREEHYQAGVLDGAFCEYDEKGEPKNAGLYRLGKEEGLWKRTEPDGSRVEESFVAGVLEGPRRQFSAEGVLLQSGAYRAGKAEGLHELFHADGKPFQSLTYTAGELSGPWLQRGQDGRVEVEGQMRQGKREGEWRYYKADGSLDREWSGRYENDRKVADLEVRR